MSKSFNQKLKLMYLQKILHEKTDEENGLTLAQIIDKLDAYGIKAERKSIYSDFEALRSYGMEIESTRGKNTTYYGISEGFQMPELKLLVDAVQSSKFITKKKSRELISKIEGLCSEHEAKKLQRQVYVSSRVKTYNESIYYNVDNIYTAIDSNKKIAFNYFEYTLQKTQKVKRDGEKYVVSPMALIWDNENYYLLGYENLQQRHYRVDKMLKIDILDEVRDFNTVQAFEKEDLALYSKRVFSMFSGETKRVRIRFSNILIGVVLDRFGNDIDIIKEDESNFYIDTDIDTSPQFFGWLTGLGSQAVILAPVTVKNQYIEHLRKTLEIQTK